MAGRKEGQKAVDLRKFLTTLIEVYNEGGTLKMVADTLGISSAAVSSRVKALKDKGVKLPKFQRGRSANIADEAAGILDELGYSGDEDDVEDDVEDEDEDTDEDE